MPGQRARLGRDALLHVAVGGDREGVVVDDVVAVAVEARREHPLGQRHPDRMRDALSQRAGGHFDPREVVVLRVPGRPRPELAELHDVVLETDVVAGQVERRIEQHRGVAG